jgi:hypothetical protein
LRSIIDDEDEDDEAGRHRVWEDLVVIVYSPPRTGIRRIAVDFFGER